MFSELRFFCSSGEAGAGAVCLTDFFGSAGSSCAASLRSRSASSASITPPRATLMLHSSARIWKVSAAQLTTVSAMPTRANAAPRIR